MFVCFFHNYQGWHHELNGQRAIGIKLMGDLDPKPFIDACKIKYGSDDYEIKAAQLVTSWEEEIKKTSWHPFKIIDQADGEMKVFTESFN